MLAEFREEVFAVSGDRVQETAVDQGRTGCEGALRAADPYRFAGEVLRLISGQAVQGMTFGHASSLPPRPSQPARDREFAQYVGQGTYPRRAVLGLGELVRRMRDAARVADEQHRRRDAGR